MNLNTSLPTHEIDTPVAARQIATEPHWYAIKTRARHEKKVVWELQSCGVKTFLPLVTEVHRWSDRNRKVEVPLFSCYAFVCTVATAANYWLILQTNGVDYFVGDNGWGTPIPDGEIEALQKLLTSKASFHACGFLKVGRRVRIRGGCLDGIEGVLVTRENDQRLVISVEPIQKSISVSLQSYDVVPV